MESEEDNTLYKAMQALLETEYAAALVRIACAAAPSDEVRPQHVQSVQILALSHTHMELAIVVAEPDGTCVSVAVQVTFPQSCCCS